MCLGFDTTNYACKEAVSATNCAWCKPGYDEAPFGAMNVCGGKTGMKLIPINFRLQILYKCIINLA